MNDLEPAEGALATPRPVFSAVRGAATWTSGGHSSQRRGVAVAAVMAILSLPPPSLTFPALIYLPLISCPHISTPQKKEAGMGKHVQDQRGQDRQKVRTRGHPGPGKEAGLPSATGWSLHPAPAPSQNDRWPPKERSPSPEQLCVWQRRAGWGAF